MTMKSGVFTALFCFSIFFCCSAQSKVSLKYAKTISSKDLYGHLSVLASDSLEGRETGSLGQKIAASYISDFFQSEKLLPPVEGENGLSFLQKFDLQRSSYNTVYLRKNDQIKKNFDDFLLYSNNETYGEEIIDVVFAGYADSLDTVDISDKYVVFINEEWTDFRETLRRLKSGNAKGYILIIEEELQFEFVKDRIGQYLARDKMSFEIDRQGAKILLAGSDIAEWIFGKSIGELKNSGGNENAEIILNADMHIFPVASENVLGFIKGSDLPEEVLVISAHYDHLGIINGAIYNGADDDASGTSAMLEIAQAFSKASNEGYVPKRSILFIAMSGEEKGLLGSKYYVSNPVFPLSNTVADLNIDMVGRVDEKYDGNSNYIYLIGSDKLSQDLHVLSEMINKKSTKLTLDYTYNADNDPNRYYYRSDHYNFAKNGVPVIFYFNGTHEDYHQSTDTIEKIDFKALKKRSKLIFLTAWEIANREERLILNK